jgi:hypothetical protein
VSKPRFLADQNFNDDILDGAFRLEPTIEVETARELEAQELPDPELLELAFPYGLILLSHDKKTMPKYAYERIRSGLHISGLILVESREPVGPIMDDLVFISLASEAEEWVDQVRYLPLRW